MNLKGFQKYAKWLLLLSTLVLWAVFFLTSFFLPSLPGADWFIRVVWALLLFCIVIFLRAIWPRGQPWERWSVWTKIVLVIITGVFFVFLGIAGVASTPTFGNWALVLAAWFFFQGLAMIRWALLYFKSYTPS